jgi:predicted transcriptional regulator of viral defense system
MKTSATLRYLESHEVFTLEEYIDAVDPTVSERTRYINLQNAIDRGQAYRIKRGLYASNLGTFRDRVPNVHLVAVKAVEDAVVTHHSALEVHGVAHSHLRTVYYTSARKVAAFAVRGYLIRRVAPPALPATEQLDHFTTRVRAGNAVVPVSTRERTLVDCLRDLDKAGGLEELLRSLGGFTSLSVDDVAEYVGLLGSPTLAARAGWTIELFRERWRISPEALEKLRVSLAGGTYRLVHGAARGEVRFVPGWRLYVPAGPPFEEWARG